MEHDFPVKKGRWKQERTCGPVVEETLHAKEGRNRREGVFGGGVTRRQEKGPKKNKKGKIQPISAPKRGEEKKEKSGSSHLRGDTKRCSAKKDETRG